MGRCRTIRGRRYKKCRSTVRGGSQGFQNEAPQSAVPLGTEAPPLFKVPARAQFRALAFSASALVIGDAFGVIHDDVRRRLLSSRRLALVNLPLLVFPM